MKVIIAGGREVTDYRLVVEAMIMADLMFGIVPTQIVSGKARGVDTLGERWAKERSIEVKPFPARWRRDDGLVDLSAGKTRNTKMAEYADALVAVWDGQSTGTADMIKKAERKKLLVWVQRFTWASRQSDQS